MVFRPGIGLRAARLSHFPGGYRAYLALSASAPGGPFGVRGMRPL